MKQKISHIYAGFGVSQTPIDRIARKECIILFVRKCCEEAKHYYTIELRGPKVVQVRGMGNCDMTPKVEAFIQSLETAGIVQTGYSCIVYIVYSIQSNRLMM